MYDVITVGSSTIDVFAKTQSELIKIMTATSEEDLIAYPSGSKILITKLDFMVGGGGTNTAVSLSRLGHKVAYLGKLGNDINADKITRVLKKEKIRFIGVKGKEKSGFSVILDSIEDDRTILTYKGANNNLKFSEIDKKNLKAKWFYFASMVSHSFEALKQIAKYAEENNIKIVFNPSNYQAEKGTSALKEILRRTEILILNDEEAALLVGKGSVNEMLKKLRLHSPNIVIITQGKKGASAYDGKSIYFVKPPKTKIAETTGAGDAFASSFLSGIIKKNDIEFALKLAIVNSLSVIQNTGAKNILLTYKDALKAMRKYRIKIIRKKF